MDEFPTLPAGTTACPECGEKLVPILYGLPSAEGFEAADRGEVALGGCTITGSDPDVQCPTCAQSFFIRKPAP